MTTNIKTRFLKCFLPTLICVLFFYQSHAQFGLDAETGIVFTGLNHARIPGDDGTFISFSGELESDPKIFGRVRAAYRFSPRSEILLLFAPLQNTYNGSVARDVFFQGVNYPAGTHLNATYKFNSYRASYRYYVLNGENLEIGIGLTIKIRDALIGLEGGELQSEKTDFGFVPLINFVINWQATDRFGLLLDGDALAAPQGRAEDVLAAVTYKLSENFSMKAGYRILEGGAGNKTVYTFSLFHYGVVGAIFRF